VHRAHAQLPCCVVFCAAQGHRNCHIEEYIEIGILVELVVAHVSNGEVNLCKHERCGEEDELSNGDEQSFIKAPHGDLCVDWVIFHESFVVLVFDGWAHDRGGQEVEVAQELQEAYLFSYAVAFLFISELFEGFGAIFEVVGQEGVLAD
jgi:hypothetical protein